MFHRQCPTFSKIYYARIRTNDQEPMNKSILEIDSEVTQILKLVDKVFKVS